MSLSRESDEHSIGISGRGGGWGGQHAACSPCRPARTAQGTVSCTRCTRPRCRLVNSISLWVRLGLDKTRLGQLFGQTNYLLHGSHAGDDAAAGSASVSHASKLDRCCTIRFYCSSLALAGTSRSARASRRSFKLRGSHRGKWCQCFFAFPPPC